MTIEETKRKLVEEFRKKCIESGLLITQYRWLEDCFSRALDTLEEAVKEEVKEGVKDIFYRFVLLRQSDTEPAEYVRGSIETCEDILEYLSEGWPGGPLLLAEDKEEEICPHSDCPRVHYQECLTHGAGTHEHNFKTTCEWTP